MKKIVGLYSTHEKAIEVVQEFKNAGYPVQQLSIIGKSIVVDDLMYISTNTWVKNVPALVGAGIGPILGILTGLKLFTISGLGFLFGIGAIPGALAGFSLGFAFGGVISLIAILVIKSRFYLPLPLKIISRV